MGLNKKHLNVKVYKAGEKLFQFYTSIPQEI